MVLDLGSLQLQLQPFALPHLSTGSRLLPMKYSVHGKVLWPRVVRQVKSLAQVMTHNSQVTKINQKLDSNFINNSRCCCDCTASSSSNGQNRQLLFSLVAKCKTNFWLEHLQSQARTSCHLLHFMSCQVLILIPGMSLVCCLLLLCNWPQQSDWNHFHIPHKHWPTASQLNSNHLTNHF